MIWTSYFALFFGFIVQIISSSVFAGLEYSYLKDSRSQIVFPKLTRSEKELVLTQINTLFSGAYIHLDKKVQKYGKKSDPVLKITKLLSSVDDLTEEKLFRGIRDAFVGMHDLHSFFRLPRPYSCYQAVLPVQFERLWEENSKGRRLKLVLNNRRTNPAIIALFPKLSDLSPGDEILKINGKTPGSVFKKLQYERTAGNKDSALVHGVIYLSDRPLIAHFAPAEDEVHIDIRGKNGDFSLSVPWLVTANTDCLKTKSLHNFQGNEKVDSIVSDIFRPTVELTVSTFVRKTASQPAFGVLKLQNFMPSSEAISNNPIKYLALIKSLIETEFKDVPFLIIDVRANNGGYGEFALPLTRLFSNAPGTTRVTSDRFLGTSFNNFFADIMTKTPEVLGLPAQVPKVIREAINKHKRYTAFVETLSPEVMEEQKVVFDRPVYVLTNALCRSACEMFVSQMKDNRIAKKIINEDSTTAGAGAAVLENNWFYDALPNNEKGPMRLLPYGMNITVSWFETFRPNGKRIEDTGIRPDVILHPHSLDESRGFGMYDRINGLVTQGRL